jgi:NAD(P)-dependent dehydrogenase (short-subunit alcohol dehydrogenase family)
VGRGRNRALRAAAEPARPDMSEDGRVCLLTGSGGLLGSAFCRAYAGRYQIAAVWSRRPPLLASQSQRVIDPLGQEVDLPENHQEVLTLRADITNRQAVERLADQVLTRFGRVDVVIHAAGFRHWAPMLDGESLLDSVARHFDVNVRAPMMLTVAIARRFWAGRAQENLASNRNVVTVSSTAGLRVYPGHGQSVYAASKAALNHLTRHMAAELHAHGVRANAVAPDSFPGIVPTERVLQAIVRLDGGRGTGQVLAVEAQGETWL